MIYGHGTGRADLHFMPARSADLVGERVTPVTCSGCGRSWFRPVDGEALDCPRCERERMRVRAERAVVPPNMPQTARAR